METIANVQFNKAGSPSEPIRRRKIVTAILALLILSIGVWATIVLINAPHQYRPSANIRHVMTYVLSKEGKKFQVCVFEINASNWEQFEFDLCLWGITHKDGDVQSFRMNLPRLESTYCWWSFHWKSRFFILATHEGLVAITERYPQRADLTETNYISLFPEGKVPDDVNFVWRGSNFRRLIFGDPGTGASIVSGFDHDTRSEMSFSMMRPGRSRHCDNPYCTICRCDDPDCDRCRDVEP